MTSTIRYRREIDGLRCLAVLAVIAFHTKKTLLPGGYLGVDVFFVISGFLITSIILNEIATQTFSLAKFWKRRIKRILPTATLVLIVVSLIQTLLIYRPDLLQLKDQKLSALFSFANIIFWKYTGDYWGNAAEGSPYLHYWSLSLEEQYYLLYPLLISALLIKWRKYLLTIIVTLVVVSFALFAYGAFHHPAATFYLLPTRTWQLGAGCLLAILSNQLPQTNRPQGTVAGILLLLGVYLFPVNTSGVGFESLIAVVGTCLILWAGSNKISRPILENGFVTFIGKISYSLYLWHLPVIVTIRKVEGYNVATSNPTSNFTLLIIGGLSLLTLTLLSYYCIETRLRKHEHGTSIAVSFTIVVGLYFFIFEPNFLIKPYPSLYKKPSWHGAYYDLNPRAELPESFQIIANCLETPKRESSINSYKTGGIVRQRSSQNIRVVLIGDSHAVMWSKAVDDVTRELDLSTSLWSMNGESGVIQIPPVQRTGDFLNKKERFEYDSSRLNAIKKWNPDIVIVAIRWEAIDGKSTIDFFNFLELHAKHVLLVESPPVLAGVGERSTYQYLSFLGMDRSISGNTNQPWKYPASNTITKRKNILKIISQHSNFTFLPTADLFLSDSLPIVASGKSVLYLDDDHLNDDGAKLGTSRFRKEIQNLLDKE